MLAFPEPILARPGPQPTGNGWRYELKIDGFRALVCTHGGRLRVAKREREARPGVRHSRNLVHLMAAVATR